MNGLMANTMYGMEFWRIHVNHSHLQRRQVPKEPFLCIMGIAPKKIFKNKNVFDCIVEQKED